jgi:hypothetical protein
LAHPQSTALVIDFQPKKEVTGKTQAPMSKTLNRLAETKAGPTIQIVGPLIFGR